MSGVKVIVRNSDGDFVQLADYIEREGWEVTQNAEEASVGISTLYMDDIDQSVWTQLGYNTGANRQIRLVDYDSGRIVHFGYVRRRAIRRRFDTYGTPVSRAWSIEIMDPNVILTRRILHHSDAKRPRETDIERINWLVGSLEWDIVNQFEIGTGEHTMSKADYRGQTTGDVVTDCAQQSGKNYWIDMADMGAGEHLTFWYGKDDRNVYYSDLSISNDLADLNVTAISRASNTSVYPPSDETEYQMDPSRIFTGIYATWEKGAIYRHNATEDIQFTRWDTSMQWPNVHEKARAEERAANMLERLDTEQEIVETAIIVPSAQAHLVRAGMRIPLKLTHIPRLTSYTDCRILSRGLSPVDGGTKYRIPLTLEPIEPTVTPPSNSCSTALAAVVVASTSDQVLSGSGGIPITMNITPTASVATLIIAAAMGYSGVNSGNDMVVGSGWTNIYHNSCGAASGYRPATAFGYKAVAVPAGATAVNFTYQGPNFGTGKGRHWGMTAVSIHTSATSPVQSAGAVDKTVTLGSAPTAGNMLVMGITVRGEEDIPGESLIGTGWTLVSSCTGSENVTAQWVRCVESGDGSQYGIVNSGLSAATIVSVSEVAIT